MSGQSDTVKLKTLVPTHTTAAPVSDQLALPEPPLPGCLVLSDPLVPTVVAVGGGAVSSLT
jgi:hypothetical protein